MNLIAFKFINFSGAGYKEVHSNKIILLFLTDIQALIALLISLMLANPVDRIIGFFLLAIYLISLNQLYQMMLL